MLETPSTAFYHGNQQNAKNLFSNIPALPMFSSSLANISLTGYFQQSSPQQELRHSSLETPLNEPVIIAPTAPTAPQQPTHSNRRTQRRVAQKQQQPPQSSVSAAIASTAPQRSNNNMGNLSSVSAAQPSRTSSSSTPNLASSSHHHNHHNNRRKKSSNKINRKKVDEAITLSAFAVEEDNQGNHDAAIGFYLNAIENMLEALPIHSNQSRKEALKNKLKDFMDREGLTDDFTASTNAPSTPKKIELEESINPKNGSGISQHIIQAAITSAVALKQSPIPDAISATMNYTMKKVQKIDEAFGLQNKAWEISRTGMNMALEIDQQYNVHEKVGNALFTGIAAAMRAGIAYKDSPSYREIRQMKTEYQNAGASSSANVNGESS